MNITSSQFRKAMKPYNTWRTKKAALRDVGYFKPTVHDMLVRVVAARKAMANDLGVAYRELEYVHTGENGRWDCENYVLYGGQHMKATWARDCRRAGDTASFEYAHIPMARLDMAHTQGLCYTQDGLYVIEWITGESMPIEDVKPKILLAG